MLDKDDFIEVTVDKFNIKQDIKIWVILMR